MRLAAALLVLSTAVGLLPARPALAAPGNDDYANARVIDSLPFDEPRDIADATSEPLETVDTCRGLPLPMSKSPPRNVVPSTAVQLPTVWYRFEPGSDLKMTIDATRSDFDVRVAVWEGEDLVTQNEVACQRFPGPLTVGLREGGSYAIQVQNWGGGSALDLTIRVSDLPGVAETRRFEVRAPDPDPLGRDVHLRGHVYLPEGQGPFAPVLEFSPYWNTAYGPSEAFTQANGDHLTMAAWLRPLIEAGFAVALVNIRGTGESDGCIQWGSRVDWADAATVVEALADAEWSTGRVGMYGLSFPGWSQMWAVASGQAPSLKAVVASSPIIDPWSLFTHNGATREDGDHRPPLFGALLASGGTTITSPSVRPFVPDTAPGHLACPRAIEEVETSPPAWNGDRTNYFTERDLRPHLDGSDVPVLTTVGIRTDDGFVGGQDSDNGHNTQLDGLWDLLDGPKRFILGQHGHDFSNHPDFEQLAVGWLDQYLRHPGDGHGRGQGRGNHPFVAPGVVDYQDDAGVWHTRDEWPPPATETTLWLSGDHLGTDPGSVEASSRTFQASEQVPCAGTCVRPIAARIPGCLGDHLVYVSEPLEEDVRLAGHVAVDLTVESTLPDGTLSAFVHHTDAEDPCTAPTLHNTAQAITDLRHVFSDTGQDFPVGEPTHLALTSMPFAGHIPAGHRIVLTIGSAGWDTEPDPFRPELTVTTGPDAVSAVHLPVVEGRFRIGEQADEPGDVR